MEVLTIAKNKKIKFWPVLNTQKRLGRDDLKKKHYRLFRIIGGRWWLYNILPFTRKIVDSLTFGLAEKRRVRKCCKNRSTRFPLECRCEYYRSSVGSVHDFRAKNATQLCPGRRGGRRRLEVCCEINRKTSRAGTEGFVSRPDK